MNQQLIFNNDFYFENVRQAVCFSCLVGGLKVCCYIALPPDVTANSFLQQVQAEAFSWEDAAEQAIAEQAYNNAGEIWL
ncbi:MAG: DUF1488 domain-containing protein [Gammaproteobacteria bacterium]|nr:DUF1488 domain-containing protein [Gammaproteobacteria bacterium]MBU1553445.1 DUF1488 domain-containing protein [Gammaproteobacteria bacterium]MBU2072388.1 DUF1488 domain-containing protein [Gammaproteobacteria bacterium]MBU2183358.1 DUF1488 domain-containing protein [Gammaproteobacteria bacterium]MBU2203145.1 DUF1488 domain-containing protein [Gammaproteobacteria bacterium]